MEEIQLSETEQRYFGDLFTCCDSDKTGKVPLYKASELFRSANLPLDVLKQITELCGGRGTHLGRRQFYSALKLIAAHQAGLPLRTDLDVPLPRLSWPSSIGKWEQPHIGRQLGSPDLIQLSDTDRTPTPQKEPAPRGPELGVDLRPDSPQRNGRSLSPASSTGVKARSPEASSTASDSPTPTNSVQERNWVTHWHSGIVCEEQRQLLGTEEESSDRHSSDEEGDAEAEAEAEVWVITEEQREYYSAQFRSLQPDPSGLIAGPVARLFFEKSRLPVHELRKIWQLADVTKDGALSLDEFNTAMHLVVLRRNNIELPDSLPATLAPPPSQPPPLQPAPAEPPSREESPPSLSPPTGEPASPPRSKEWTKFVDSPTSSVSSPGPKPVNFDFHKSAVEQDPKILHPVPLRLTPESQGLPPNEEEPCRSPRKATEPQPIPYEQLPPEGASPKKGLVSGGIPPALETGNPTCTAAADIRPIQRPQAKKPAAPGPGAIPPPPQASSSSSQDEGNSNQSNSNSGPTSLPVAVASAPPIGPKKEPPPPPPPRPYRTHTRSSSLDLNRLGKSGGLLGTPPVVPPRVSPSTTSPKKLIGQRSEGDVLALVGDQASFADFTQFGQEDEGDVGQPRRHGAFEVYRKPVARTGGSDAGLVLQEADSPDDTSQRHRPRETLRRLREQNSLLVRVCQELAQELAEVQEERAGLELQLEQLRGELQAPGAVQQPVAAAAAVAVVAAVSSGAVSGQPLPSAPPVAQLVPATQAD